MSSAIRSLGVALAVPYAARGWPARAKCPSVSPMRHLPHRSNVTRPGRSRADIRTVNEWPNISCFSPSRGGADQDSPAVHGCQPEMCQTIRQCKRTSGQPLTRSQCPEQREGQVVYAHNEEKMTFIRFRPPQLGQMTLGLDTTPTGIIATTTSRRSTCSKANSPTSPG